MSATYSQSASASGSEVLQGQQAAAQPQPAEEEAEAPVELSFEPVPKHDFVPLNFDDARAAYKSKSAFDLLRTYAVLSACQFRPLVCCLPAAFCLAHKLISATSFFCALYCCSAVCEATCYPHFAGTLMQAGGFWALPVNFKSLRSNICPSLACTNTCWQSYGRDQCKVVSMPSLQVNNADWLLKTASKFPGETITHGVVRHTFFKHFCAGEFRLSAHCWHQPQCPSAALFLCPG